MAGISDKTDIACSDSGDIGIISLSATSGTAPFRYSVIFSFQFCI